MPGSPDIKKNKKHAFSDWGVWPINITTKDRPIKTSVLLFYN